MCHNDTHCSFSSGHCLYWEKTASAHEWISTPLWNCLPLMSHTPTQHTYTHVRIELKNIIERSRLPIEFIGRGTRLIGRGTRLLRIHWPYCVEVHVYTCTCIVHLNFNEDILTSFWLGLNPSLQEINIIITRVLEEIYIRTLQL